MKFPLHNLRGHSLHTPETRRKALELVSSMMAYRRDALQGLESEMHQALDDMRAARTPRRARQVMKRIAGLLDRTRQLSLDNRFDAIHLMRILHQESSHYEIASAASQEDTTRYIC